MYLQIVTSWDSAVIDLILILCRNKGLISAPISKLDKAGVPFMRLHCVSIALANRFYTVVV